jgi:hypothetical protein
MPCARDRPRCERRQQSYPKRRIKKSPKYQINDAAESSY